ncbi:unnamed protein product, partial [Discosporangium mesarthrocarpum]
SARLQREGWEARWGEEEPARAAGQSATAAPVTITPAVLGGLEVHPAYAARLQRAGWEARWGAEEKERVSNQRSDTGVQGAEAGVMAVAGAVEG